MGEQLKFCGRCDSWFRRTYLEHDEYECELIQEVKSYRKVNVTGLRNMITELEEEVDEIKARLYETLDKR